MLKFIKHNMETIAGIEIFPIISLLIFFIFFVGLFFWVFTYKKETIEKLSNLPFMDEEQPKKDSKLDTL
ncbi:CcoQ/FixQ family Cbb3-type cytochrome c oxidase assembly chaperone [Myroides guanonis]|uniref:Cbb3-type cytochrome oxidase component FixQ n=1 Tax=Myroides guanonis TaxID=1150112 RepID=A0A1I3UEB3_9FLAO|nr:CcoQ/FixQ family Cbb3-type cytochrome c oxidase assembly chaperone [Myroides guanonis]SFJ81370.1 Cbb3-type cytochrome oxidase component FixQ [Myroides guanonis]